MSATEMVEHARAYARALLAVLPLKVQQKVPATVHGNDDATTDLDQIREWWTQNPLYNIGVRPSAGMIVLDIDPRNGGGLDALGDIPPTWTAATGGGGLHLWFRCPGKMRGQLAGTSGIDIKTSSGYLVAPPSLHESGRRYEWLNRHPIAPLPAHLRSRVRMAPARRPLPQIASQDGKQDALVRAVAEAPQGNRNHMLFWAACRAVTEGHAPTLIHQLRQAAVCNGLTEREIETTIRSAMRRTA